MTATVYTLIVNITHIKKILTARNIDKKKMGWKETKSCRDFSQNPLMASFSSAYLLPPRTFFGSNICVLDT